MRVTTPTVARVGEVGARAAVQAPQGPGGAPTSFPSLWPVGAQKEGHFLPG